MKHAALYYIAETFEGELYNAGVVRKQQEAILQEAGFTPLRLKFSKKKSIFFKLARLLQCLWMAIILPANSRVLFQVPLQASAIYWLLTLLHLRSIHTVALIIDLDGIRDCNENLLKQEVKILRKFKLVVVHNDAMKLMLSQHLQQIKIIGIRLFDYPFADAIKIRELTNQICFAGNIAKSEFVYALNKLPAVQFNIYGTGFDILLNKCENIFYKAVVMPNVLPAVLEGSFGLVWDGDSIDRCNDYLRYNNPHKLSLYLTAGLPVIAWEQSATASFIKEKNIGITVDNLLEIPARLLQITAADYKKMQQNAGAIGRQTASGHYLKSVIKTLLIE